RHARLVEEDAAEVLAVGEDVGLEGEEGAARIDQVDAAETVLERDLLRAKVLLHGERVVGAALHGGVVGDQHALAAGDASDAGHDARARRLVVVAGVRRERRELEERRPGVEETRDALARQELPAGGVAAAGLFGPAERGARAGRAQPLDQPLRVGGVGAELGIGRADPGREPAHQKSERRAARPSASMVAIRAFTCSTFSPITSSSSLGFPVKRIGSPKWMRYLTGKGRTPRRPSHAKVRVTGKAGMPSRRASGIALAIAIVSSSDPTTAMGTIGVSVSSARRMKPWPNSCSW